MQLVSAAKDHFHKDNDVRWQPSRARQLAKGNPQGKRADVHQFYTPSCVVRRLVEMLAPHKGRIYDPACGFADKFVQPEKFVESHGGKLGDISISSQDKWARRQRPFGFAKRARRVRLQRKQPNQSNPTTRRFAIMNLALRGIEADFSPENADTFRRELHPDLLAA
jgi:type I restriction enzyme M protein